MRASPAAIGLPGSLTPTLADPRQVYLAWRANRAAATAPRDRGRFLFVSGQSVLETVDEGVTFRVLVQNLASATPGRSTIVQHSPLMVIPSCDAP